MARLYFVSTELPDMVFIVARYFTTTLICERANSLSACICTEIITLQSTKPQVHKDGIFIMKLSSHLATAHINLGSKLDRLALKVDDY